MNLPSNQQPVSKSHLSKRSPAFGILTFFFLTPVNLMGERVCDSRNESLLELGWPQAGAVSRFERPCSDPQLRAEMKKTDA